MVVFGFLISALYPSLSKMTAFSQYWEQFPKNLKNLFGGSNVNILTPEGFLTLEYYQMILIIILAAFTLGFTASCIVKARENGTLELILAHPIERWKYTLTSSVSLATALAGLSLLAVATIMAASPVFDMGISFAGQLKLLVILWFMMLALGSISLFASAAFNSTGQVYGLGIGILIASYLINYLGNNWSAFKFIDRAFLYHYYAPYSAMTESGFPWASLLYYALVSVAFTTLAVIVLQRRDISV
ncbi:MAG: hypothetical protein A2W01_11905 [Candidatus Solincola sediminis]|uniref:ABC transporter permease n=1 Tax=Candidatus Solincola sediminis TaxID=1797199 RepID=A0A1F2WTD7_9ACTN|nr:MAG: hypothetical protein A2Y75_02495 [Candidatus Solincola sediminis]OFW60882.1 MAG: hypothetical protein A2W01_11905 [Candidatus Solincola sediminis]